MIFVFFWRGFVVRLLSFVFASFFFVSCSMYQEAGYYGAGYSEIQTSEDSFIVNFRGYSNASDHTVLRYAMLRASELTLQKGYSFFEIVSTEDLSKTYNYSQVDTSFSESSKHKNASISESKKEETKIIPSISLKVKCFKDKPKGDQVIDASFFWSANREKE